MKKRLLALSMAMIMVAGTLTACTTEEPATGTEATEAPAEGGEEATEAPAEGGEEATEAPAVEDAATMEAPDPSGWDESMKIYAYSWNDEFGSRLQMVLDKYPEYSDYVEFINLGVNGTGPDYKTQIEQATNSDKYPSLIPADNDVAKYFMDQVYVQPVSEVGITSDMYANAYQYTVDYATVGGDLMAVTWQATPGCLIYRTDIAEEVLGTSDPAEVQEAVKDWDAFFETAEAMKEAGYAMVSGPDEAKYAIWDQQTQPWITVAEDGSETLSLDDSIKQDLENAKKLYDGGYVTAEDALMWTNQWNANYRGDVFCYFGCTWSVYWCMATDMQSEEDYQAALAAAETEADKKALEEKRAIDLQNPDSTFGKWHICQGPVAYHWGGTYVCVGADTPNPELCGFLLYELCCDKDMMYEISADTKDYVNNKAAMQKISDDGKGVSEQLGGQDAVAIWLEAAPKIDLSNASYLDSDIKGIADEARKSYVSGTFADVDTAVQFIKDEVKKKFSNVTVE